MDALLAVVLFASHGSGISHPQVKVISEALPLAAIVVQLLADARDRIGQREEAAVDVHVGVGGEGMPEDAVHIGRDLGDQVRHVQVEPLFRVAAFGQRAHEMILIGDAQGAMEDADLFQPRGVDGCFRRAQAHTKATFLQQLDAFHRFGPRAFAPVGIVIFVTAAVETHLNDQVVIGDVAQAIEPGPTQNHGIGKHGRLDPRRRIGQHRVDVVEDERLAAGEKDIAETEIDGFVHQAQHVGQAQRPPRRIGAGLGDAVGTAQVAVVVGVQPQFPRKHG